MTENELNPINRCSYRHCSKVVEGTKRKKFCCDSHRKMEHTYKKRKESWLKSAILLNQKEVDGYKNLVELVKNSNQ